MISECPMNHSTDEIKKILIVDDDKEILTSLKMLFEMKNYEVHTAENGRQCLNYLEEGFQGLIILDIMMPIIDGYQTLVRLKADSTLANIPVLMLTAKTGASDVVKALEIGANDYLKKPFDIEELVARVNNLVALKQAQDALDNNHRLTLQ